MKLIKKKYDENERTESSDEKFLNISNTEFSQYADFFEKNNLDELLIEEKGTKILFRKNSYTEVSQSAAPAHPVSVPIASDVELPDSSGNEQPAETDATDSNADNNLIPVLSPLNGTFYSSSSPDAPAFVTAGDQVNSGDVLCIVEAMKIFNELKAEISGKIVKVLAQKGDSVKEGQQLFLIDPA